MRIDALDYDRNLSQDIVDEIVNNMRVNLDEFSRIACLDGKAYGVTTLCSDCSIEIDRCARIHLVKELVGAQATAEKRLHSDVTPKYHVYEKLWDGSQKITVKPGVSAVNVRRNYGDPTTVSISPYILEGVVAEDSGDGFCILKLDQTVVENPNKILVRTTEDAYVKTQQINRYPKRHADGDWLVALDKPEIPSNGCDGREYNIQHCEYMYADFTPDCEEGESALPFYPNSNQFIPMAKPIQDLGGGEFRYWFHPWVLLDSAFIDEGADLSKGYPDFSHLLQSIEFRCVSEIEAVPTIYWLDLDNNCIATFTADTDVSVKVWDSEKGILLIDPAYFRCSSCGCTQTNCRCGFRAAMKIKVYYRTDPHNIDLDEWSGFISEAIAHLAAAELPIAACNCNIGNEGFIWKAQQPYNKSKHIVSGGSETIIVDPKVGQLYGQLVFREKLARVKQTTPIRTI